MHDTPKSSEKRTWMQRAEDYLHLHLFARRTKDPATCGDQQTTKTVNASKSSNIAQSCKDVTLNQFISCAVEGNYTVLGEGTETELYAAWLRVLNDYYRMLGDDGYTRHMEVITAILGIQWRQLYIDYMLHAMSLKYLEEVAQLLREEYPKFKFTPDTYQTEMGYVRTIEKRNEMRLEELQNELKQLEKTKQGRKTTREDYLEMLLDINKHEGSSYTTEISAELYAICIRRLKNTIERNGRQHK